MTDQHPLTDEICADIVQVNYSLPESSYCEDMRVAADWQLEQVIEWLRHNLHLMPTGVDYIVENLREAMRPTQEDN